MKDKYDVLVSVEAAAGVGAAVGAARPAHALGCLKPPDAGWRRDECATC